MYIDLIDKNNIRSSFELYKSEVCHLVKDLGYRNFIIEVLKSNKIESLYEKRWFPECFYLLAMVDYLSRINNVPLCLKYNKLRTLHLQEPIFPIGVILLDKASNSEKYSKEILAFAIPEFLRHNIVEREIQDVC